MPIAVEWNDQLHTLLRMKAEATWNLEELRQASQEAIALIRNVPHRVYVISDFSQTHHLPLGILWEMRHLNKIIPPNWGGSVAVTQDHSAATIVMTLSQIYLERSKKRLAVTTSEAEACQLIDRWRHEDEAADNHLLA